MDAYPRRTRTAKLTSVPTDRLERGALQPRRTIDGLGLKKLAESIRAEGVIQPIFVRKAGWGRFEIVAGERRWHAAKMAGLKSVPALIGDVTDEAALAIALIENLHREELNPLDQALAMQRLVDDFSMTHQQIADLLGKSRTAVTNLLRLLELPVDVQAMIEAGELDMGHARALLALPAERRLQAAHYVATHRLSVRDVERLAKHGFLPGADAPRVDVPGAAMQDGEPAEPTPIRPSTAWPISLRRGKTGRCHVSFSFASREELEAAVTAINGLAAELDAVPEEESPQLSMDYG
jgi:ParB family transcriptional regulator, chromosome partitioning protein